MLSLPRQGCDREGGTRGLVQSFEPEFPISFLINHLLREKFHNSLLICDLLEEEFRNIVNHCIDDQEKKFRFTEHYRGLKNTE